MKEVLIRILTVALLCGMIDLLTPAGEREGLRRAVRLLAGLFLLCAMLTPLSRLDPAAMIRSLGEWARQTEQLAQREYETRMEEKLTAVTTAQLEEEVADLLERQMNIVREDCTVMAETAQGTEGFVLTHIRIALRGAARLIDPRRIESLVGEAAGCPCTVFWE